MPDSSTCPTCGQALPSPSGRLLTPEEMVPILRAPGRLSVIRMARAGRIPCVRVNRAYRFDAEKVKAALEQKQERLPRAAKGKRRNPSNYSRRVLEKAGV